MIGERIDVVSHSLQGSAVGKVGRGKKQSCNSGQFKFAILYVTLLML